MLEPARDVADRAGEFGIDGVLGTTGRRRVVGLVEDE